MKTQVGKKKTERKMKNRVYVAFSKGLILVIKSDFKNCGKYVLILGE